MVIGFHTHKVRTNRTGGGTVFKKIVIWTLFLPDRMNLPGQFSEHAQATLPDQKALARGAGRQNTSIASAWAIALR